MAGQAGRLTAAIWHNPHCGTSRAVLALLEEAGVEVRVIEYLKTPPSVAKLHRLYVRAGTSPRDGLRRAEPDAAHLLQADDAIMLEAMIVNPILIQRPLVVTAKGVVPARPPERMRAIL